MIKRKLEEETERLEVLPESQGGFRKGRGTMDNIFILNHIVRREKIKREKKVFALFVDLKAAFDNIKREKLWSIIEELEIEKHTIGRVKRMYEETRMTIRTEDGLTEAFSTKKDVRQGCVMSPLLFNPYIADLGACEKEV